MAHYKFTGGGRIKNADNWSFQTNPYITARPQISCVGDECKRSNLDIYYQYGTMEVNPPELLQYVPIIALIILVLVIFIIFLIRRAKANKRYEESMLSRIDDVNEREYYSAF